MKFHKDFGKLQAQLRKETPVYSGFVKYFPRAMKEVSRVSKAGNDQHHPGEPLWWDKEKSPDHLDALMRHMIDDAMGEEKDIDEQLHLAKLAWRAMANLEIFLEKSGQ